MTTPSTLDLNRSVQIDDSQVYEEYLTLTPIGLMPGSHDLWIRSRLDSAKDPVALQTRHRIVLSTGAIERLHRYLGEYLQDQQVTKEGATTNRISEPRDWQRPAPSPI